MIERRVKQTDNVLDGRGDGAPRSEVNGAAMAFPPQLCEQIEIKLELLVEVLPLLENKRVLCTAQVIISVELTQDVPVTLLDSEGCVQADGEELGNENVLGLTL